MFFFSFDVIIDIGCGSGNVTTMLDSRLKCKQIVAVDIDMKAVKFAKHKHPSARIEYIIQDISDQWENLDQVLQGFEGKADLIFSNRCLHWIENKERAIENVFRLLKPGGKLYANVTTLYNLFYDLNGNEKEEVDKVLRIPSASEQVQQYNTLLAANTFRDVQVENTMLSQVYQHDEFKNVHLPYFPNLTKKYLLEVNPIKRNKIMSSGLSDKVKQAFLRNYCREVNTGNPEKPDYELHYEQIRIFATK